MNSTSFLLQKVSGELGELSQREEMGLQLQRKELQLQW